VHRGQCGPAAPEPDVVSEPAPFDDGGLTPSFETSASSVPATSAAELESGGTEEPSAEGSPFAAGVPVAAPATLPATSPSIRWPLGAPKHPDDCSGGQHHATGQSRFRQPENYAQNNRQTTKRPVVVTCPSTSPRSS
jgi:hypothetical protein